MNTINVGLPLFCFQISQNSETPTIKESTASKNLLKKVDSMITKLDKVLEDLEAKEVKLHQDLTQADAKQSELVRIDEIITTIRKVCLNKYICNVFNKY